VSATYAPTANSGDLWLPADMRELYVGRDRKLECEATYRNIRQFLVSTEVRLPSDGRAPARENRILATLVD
jgi:hypothetical protein